MYQFTSVPMCRWTHHHQWWRISHADGFHSNTEIILLHQSSPDPSSHALTSIVTPVYLQWLRSDCLSAWPFGYSIYSLFSLPPCWFCFDWALENNLVSTISLLLHGRSSGLGIFFSLLCMQLFVYALRCIRLSILWRRGFDSLHLSMGLSLQIFHHCCLFEWISNRTDYVPEHRTPPRYIPDTYLWNIV